MKTVILILSMVGSLASASPLKEGHRIHVYSPFKGSFMAKIQEIKEESVVLSNPVLLDKEEARLERKWERKKEQAAMGYDSLLINLGSDKNEANANLFRYSRFCKAVFGQASIMLTVTPYERNPGAVQFLECATTSKNLKSSLFKEVELR